MGNVNDIPFDFSRSSWPPSGDIGPARFLTYSKYVSKGSCRLCYLGKDTVTEQLVVLKRFKEDIKDKEKQWRLDIEASKEAQRFAKQFNMELKSSKPITFIEPIIYKCPSSISAPFQAGEEVLVEPYLGKDRYEKFNSNSGWVNESCGSSMAAFSHFTYHNSSGKKLVCDLQGIKIGDKYILTDPAICSVHRDFGMTDVSEDGIRSFFASHQCTDLCKSTWMKHTSPKQYSKVIMGTTYLH